MNDWPSNSPETPKFNLERELPKLELFLEKLTEKGFNVRSSSEVIEQLKLLPRGIAAPIVYDGDDGIRVSFNNRKGILIGFTNSFENPDHPKVKEVKALWQEVSSS